MIQQNWLWTWPLFRLLSWDHYHHKMCQGGKSICLPGSLASHILCTCTSLPPGVQLCPTAQLWCPQSQWVSTGGVTDPLLLLGNQTQNACTDQCWSYSGPGMLSLSLPTWNTHPWCFQHIGVNKPGPHRGRQTTSACFLGCWQVHIVPMNGKLSSKIVRVDCWGFCHMWTDITLPFSSKQVAVVRPIPPPPTTTIHWI